MSLISLKNITKVYENGQSEIKALNNISLEVDKGELIAVMGSSGCGKSTLLNVLGCIDTPTSGSYHIEGNDIDFSKLNTLNKIRNEKVSFIFQNFALIKELTSLENVMLPLRFRKGSKKEMGAKAEKYLDELGILNIKNKNMRELSGGQQQRVAIARALCQESDIILADEPTGALDEDNSIKIMDILLELNKKYNKTIIVVTHDKLVSSYCNKILEMKDGIWI